MNQKALIMIKGSLFLHAIAKGRWKRSTRSALWNGLTQEALRLNEMELFHLIKSFLYAKYANLPTLTTGSKALLKKLGPEFLEKLGSLPYMCFNSLFYGSFFSIIVHKFWSSYILGWLQLKKNLIKYRSLIMLFPI